MGEMVVLVNEQDEQVGTEEKLAAHQNGGKLHRAFSIYLLNDKGATLIQKRAKGKYHSPGKWANTACGHNRPGETIEEAAARRLKEELNIETPLTKIAERIYEADVGKELTEHEYLHIFVGKYNDTPTPNPEEAETTKYIGLEEWTQDLREHPQDYAGWIHFIYPVVLPLLKEHIKSS